jgi:isoquinoline 1-oxidoreductase alpha subunit
VRRSAFCTATKTTGTAIKPNNAAANGGTRRSEAETGDVAELKAAIRDLKRTAIGGSMVTLNINGHDHSVDAPNDTPLLWVIREHLQMTGTKFGCGAGLCGACTVHLHGEAVRSCQTAVSQAAGKKITTIEGLDSKGEHPLQRAWIAEQVPQCGYCQSGQIMQAASLLAKNTDPTKAEVVAHMDGNLCRCMSYVRIQRAILRAAAEMRGV